MTIEERIDVFERKMEVGFAEIRAEIAKLSRKNDELEKVLPSAQSVQCLSVVEVQPGIAIPECKVSEFLRGGRK